jgi:hypothetical protein
MHCSGIMWQPELHFVCLTALRQGFAPSQIACERFLNLRYEGTDVAVMTPCPADGDYAAAFEAAYRREFGFVMEGREVVVDDVRVRATGRAAPLPEVEDIPEPPGKCCAGCAWRWKFFSRRSAALSPGLWMLCLQGVGGSFCRAWEALFAGCGKLCLSAGRGKLSAQGAGGASGVPRFFETVQKRLV